MNETNEVSPGLGSVKPLNAEFYKYPWNLQQLVSYLSKPWGQAQKDSEHYTSLPPSLSLPEFNPMGELLLQKARSTRREWMGVLNEEGKIYYLNEGGKRKGNKQTVELNYLGLGSGTEIRGKKLGFAHSHVPGTHGWTHTIRGDITFAASQSSIKVHAIIEDRMALILLQPADYIVTETDPEAIMDWYRVVYDVLKDQNFDDKKAERLAMLEMADIYKIGVYTGGSFRHLRRQNLSTYEKAILKNRMRPALIRKLGGI